MSKPANLSGKECEKEDGAALTWVYSNPANQSQRTGELRKLKYGRCNWQHQIATKIILVQSIEFFDN